MLMMLISDKNQLKGRKYWTNRFSDCA